MITSGRKRNPANSEVATGGRTGRRRIRPACLIKDPADATEPPDRSRLLGESGAQQLVCHYLIRMEISPSSGLGPMSERRPTCLAHPVPAGYVRAPAASCGRHLTGRPGEWFGSFDPVLVFFAAVTWTPWSDSGSSDGAGGAGRQRSVARSRSVAAQLGAQDV